MGFRDEHSSQLRKLTFRVDSRQVVVSVLAQRGMVVSRLLVAVG